MHHFDTKINAVSLAEFQFKRTIVWTGATPPCTLSRAPATNVCLRDEINQYCTRLQRGRVSLLNWWPTVYRTFSPPPQDQDRSTTLQPSAKDGLPSITVTYSFPQELYLLISLKHQGANLPPHFPTFLHNRETRFYTVEKQRSLFPVEKQISHVST